MFAATVANFVLFTLCIGTELAALVVYIRKALTLDIDYPFVEKQDLVNNAFNNMDLVMLWSGGLLVSIKLSLLDPVSNHAWWRYFSAISLSFGGLGPSSQTDSGYSSYRSFCGL